MATLPYTANVEMAGNTRVICNGFPLQDYSEYEWSSWGDLNPRRSKRREKYINHKRYRAEQNKDIILKYGNDEELVRYQSGDDKFFPTRYYEDKSRRRAEERQYQLETHGYYLNDKNDYLFCNGARNNGNTYSSIDSALNSLFPNVKSWNFNFKKLEFDLDAESDAGISFNSAKLDSKYCRIISKHRNDLNLTMAEVAKRLNITEAEYKHYESTEGVLCPNQSVITKIQSVLGINTPLVITKPKNVE